MLTKASLNHLRLTRQVTCNGPKRHIYFTRPDRDVEMVDFALNLGYNDLYGDYCGNYLNWQGKMKLGFRKLHL